ncbi:PAS domain-containing protein [Flavobacterium sp. CG_9.1]|uniref:PAS domain S-box protein n=1 Tax=Flavobacterium sp. CG_9.1 TaxID=2787728 RepID=UPI0018CA4E05
MIRDISDRVFVQEALVNAETRYKYLFDSVKDGILFVDGATGKINAVNPFFINLIGLSKESFIGKEVWTVEFFKNIIKNKKSFIEFSEKNHSNLITRIWKRQVRVVTI